MTALYNYRLIEQQWHIADQCEEDSDVTAWRTYAVRDTWSRYCQMREKAGIPGVKAKTIRGVGGVFVRDWDTDQPLRMKTANDNVIPAADIYENYGFDTLRMYELFICPPHRDAIWDDDGVDGVYRFLNRFFAFSAGQAEAGLIAAETKKQNRFRNMMIRDLTEKMDLFALNAAAAQYMFYYHEMKRCAKEDGGIEQKTLEAYVTMMSPFAPDLCQELWKRLGHADRICEQPWPVYREEAVHTQRMRIPVQINGKVRASIEVSSSADQDTVTASARFALGDRINAPVQRIVYIPGKIINFVLV